MSIMEVIKMTLGLLLVTATLSFGEVYNANGDQFDKSQGKIPSRIPYEVVDTVRMVDGIGYIVLNGHVTREKHNVKPTNKNNMMISCLPILDDTSGTVYYYAAYISNNLDTIILKSNNNTDTSKVHIRILMK